MLYYFIRLQITLLILLFVLYSNGDQDVCSAEDESLAKSYIDQHFNASGTYRVQGWRWHTQSVLREIKLVIDSFEARHDNIRELIRYVIGFNLSGLHNIEERLFYPWLGEKFSLIAEENIRIAYQRLLRDLIEKKGNLASVGRVLNDASSKENLNRGEIKKHLQSMVITLNEICRIQNKFVAPTVALLVPEKEQIAFNSKIVRKLGILDSRLYLVGMHEAVLNNENELKLFKQEIPSIPQYFLPRWKRTLYDAKFTNLL